MTPETESTAEGVVFSWNLFNKELNYGEEFSFTSPP
jgi:hypothetical protein